MGLVRHTTSTLLLILSAALPAFPQTRSAGEIKAEETKLYADAHPYLDQSLPQLKKTLRELEGLKPPPPQIQLPQLLAKIATKADELLKQVPDLISDEEVDLAQSTVLKPGFSVRVSRPVAEKFNYIILTHDTPDGRVLLQEYRTGRNDTPIPEGPGGPHFQGFVSVWMVLSSSRQFESRFRCLGIQNIDGHHTLVIGFAQIPGALERPGLILTDKRQVPLLLQGIAWVDASDFRIVQVRTDILAPLPDIKMQQNAASVAFGPVRIKQLAATLWLPQTADVEMEFNDVLLLEQHRYSKYRLYRAKSRIVLTP